MPGCQAQPPCRRLTVDRNVLKRPAPPLSAAAAAIASICAQYSTIVLYILRDPFLNSRGMGPSSCLAGSLTPSPQDIPSNIANTALMPLTPASDASCITGDDQPELLVASWAGPSTLGAHHASSPSSIACAGRYRVTRAPAREPHQRHDQVGGHRAPRATFSTFYVLGRQRRHCFNRDMFH